MIGLLHAIFDVLLRVLARQDEAAEQAASDLSATIDRIASASASAEARLEALSAAVEHLRVLIEDSDNLPAVVGAPTFTPTGDSQ